MRLINADAFDKCLEGAEIEATKSRKYVFSSAINTIRGNLANFPIVNQWVPCSERLPKYGQIVITYNLKNDEYELNHIIDEEDGEWFTNGVDAWMPLPEPYKEEGEEE